MEKKVIAIVSILVLMLSVFSACAKKAYTKNIGGEDYPVVTDENGELITGIDGRLALYVTDEAGRYVTDEDNQPRINYFEVATDVILNDDNIVSNGFRISIPEGWKADNTSGRIYKDKTDNKCYMEVIKAHEIDTESSDSDETDSFDTYIYGVLALNDDLINKINNGEAENDKFSSAKMSKKALDRVPEGIINSIVVQYIVYDKDGNVVHYAENIYLEKEDHVIYEIAYLNSDGAGYDPDFDFEKWAADNITKLY